MLEFFASMGFRCPERKGVADFLQEVISVKDQQVRMQPGLRASHIVKRPELSIC